MASGATSYRAFGLRLDSEVPFPELPAGRGPADVRVILGRVRGTPDREVLAGVSACVRPRSISLWYPDGTRLRSEPDRITLQPGTGVDPRVLRLLLLGPAIGLLLHLRGFLVLHASAVEVEGRAVLLAGAPASGKSTLAACLVGRGHLLLADDVAAVDTRARWPAVLPAFPQLKLWPDAASALGDDPALMPLLEPEVERREKRAARFARRPAPLGRVLLLAHGRSQSIAVLSPREGLIELIRNSFCNLVLGDLASAHFEQAARLAREGLVARLRRPRSLHRLSETARLVEAT